MDEIAFFAESCYTRKNRMKEYLKVGLFFSLFVVCAAGFVVATTLGVIHYNNTQGQGGLETPGLPELMATNLETGEVLDMQSEEIIPDDSEDKPLWYFSYCIKPNDQIGKLAESFNITQDTIISINNIKESRLIQPGQYLKIPSMPGILYTIKDSGETINGIAEKYKVDAQKCALANNIQQDESIAAGRTIFVPDAKLDWATVQEINGDLFHNPLHSWYYISSRYGWRTSPFDSSRRTFHGGLDMACSQGTPIYAALSGTVIEVGYNNVYGNYAIVKHGKTGYKTLYGHMSSVDVKQGQAVVTSTRIGRVGSTGMSTGPHLHFTVYKNGRSINPQGVLN